MRGFSAGELVRLCAVWAFAVLVAKLAGEVGGHAVGIIKSLAPAAWRRPSLTGGRRGFATRVRGCGRAGGRLSVDDPTVIELREWSRIADDLSQERTRATIGRSNVPQRPDRGPRRHPLSALGLSPVFSRGVLRSLRFGLSISWSGKRNFRRASSARQPAPRRSPNCSCPAHLFPRNATFLEHPPNWR